nr:unnamed protein product [Digitaria exilis]
MPASGPCQRRRCGSLRPPAADPPRPCPATAAADMRLEERESRNFPTQIHTLAQIAQIAPIEPTQIASYCSPPCSPAVDAAPSTIVVACCRLRLWLNSSPRLHSAVVLHQLLTPPLLLTVGLSRCYQ